MYAKCIAKYSPHSLSTESGQSFKKNAGQNVRLLRLFLLDHSVLVRLCTCFVDKSSTAWHHHKKVRTVQIFLVVILRYFDHFFFLSSVQSLYFAVFIRLLCAFSFPIAIASNFCAIIYICVLVLGFSFGWLLFALSSTEWLSAARENGRKSFLFICEGGEG